MLAQLTSNQVMVLLINTVRDAVKPYFALLANLAGPQEQVRTHQRELLHAVTAGDAVSAARIADEYLKMGAQLAARASGRVDFAPLPTE